MDLLGAVWEYIVAHSDRFGEALQTHVTLSGFALVLALLLMLPLGIATSRWHRAGALVLNGVGVARVVPSIAVLLLLLPLLGTGFRPSLVALTLLACPPILINTDAGLRGLDPAILEAGRGMGFTGGRLLRDVQLPLAAPVILTGVRTAAVEVIASASLATLIGGGGLGQFVYSGLELNNNAILLAGALPIAGLALGTQAALSMVQRGLETSGARRPSHALQWVTGRTGERT
ncbi:MAG TPA: ABC transporter permease [Chloroflexia bacterium]|nr:ABC transporter permease [Chloroflexia bacterium]